MAGQRVARGARTSLTFRKARGYACSCPYPDSCDSQDSTVPPTRALQRLQAASADDSAVQQADCKCGMATGRCCGTQAADATGQQACAHDGARSASSTMPIVSGGMCGGAGASAEQQQLPGAQGSPWLEAQHVHHVYDAIAPHFSATRCNTPCCSPASAMMSSHRRVDATQRGFLEGACVKLALIYARVTLAAGTNPNTHIM